MIEIAISVIDVVALIASAAALAILWAGGKRAFRHELMLLFSGVLVLILGRNFSNALEWSHLTTVLDPFEDYIEILLPTSWGFFFYVFLRGIAQRELQESEKRYRMLFETTPHGIVEIDKAGRILASNLAHHRMLGYRDGELIGVNFAEVLVEDNRETAASTLATSVAGQIAPDAVEIQHLTKDAERIDCKVDWGCKRNREGEISGFVCVVTDITEGKRIRREREELIASLETQNAELERFTYSVSHDLKSPLITIKGFLGLLRQDLTEGKTETIESDLTRISNAADHMGRLLQELLELSRIGRISSPPEDILFSELAEEAVAFVTGQITQRGVDVRISLDSSTIHGDRPRLLEILQNLIDNAVKYMGDQPKPCVEIGTRLYGGETICYVRDNGLGIEPQYQQTVFRLFDQLDRQAEGSGVGLALVKRIVEVHGGRIWIESEGAGKGSTFCFTIPSKDEVTSQERVGE